MKEHEKNAQQVADYLQEHPKVKKVNYPGLKSHPQYELAQKQMSGFGGMLSFEIVGGLKEAEQFLGNLKIFSLAESLGGVESLIEHPARMTHASVPPEIRKQIGITDSLIRTSVGIENIDDLVKDLDQAFKKVD
jgi:cystathionine gamma-lyase